METAYDQAAWQALFGAVAGSSASLTGLLFVALSVNRQAIMGSAAQEARSIETLGTLLTLLVVAIIVLIPGQDRAALGAELAVLGAILLGASSLQQRRTLAGLDIARRRFWIGRLVLLNLGTSCVPIAGLSCVAGRAGGLYWLLPVVLIYFLWAATNAWVLVLHEDTAS